MADRRESCLEVHPEEAGPHVAQRQVEAYRFEEHIRVPNRAPGKKTKLVRRALPRSNLTQGLSKGQSHHLAINVAKADRPNTAGLGMNTITDSLKPEGGGFPSKMWRYML